ncbi:MAG: exosortase C-terminal domain/associated protein EpsI [Gemmatimonadaceae bacterium]
MRDLRLLPPLVLLLGCAFVWNARSQRPVPLAAPLTTVLANVPDYRVEDQKLSEEEAQVAGMSQYIARAYWRDSMPAFSIFVSYYERQTQGKTIHSPRNCLPGAGWEVLTAGTATLPNGAAGDVVNRYVLKNDNGSTAVVYYWYQGRGRIVANEYAVKWNLLRDAAVSGHTEEALVRVVVPVASAKLGSPEEDRAMADATTLGATIAAKLRGEVARVLPRT